jgi:N-methylhydantoinase A
MHQDGVDLGTANAIYAKLEQEAVDTLTRDGIERSRIRLVREADVRYAGQSMEVRVPAPSGAVDEAFLTTLIDTFSATHKRTFGYNYAGQQKIEIVNFCVSGFGLIERPELPKLAKRGGVTPVRKAIRPVFFNGTFHDTPVYDRTSLLPGFRIDGPAVVQEFGSTTVVFPSQYLEVDPHGVLIVRSSRRPTEVKR